MANPILNMFNNQQAMNTANQFGNLLNTFRSFSNPYQAFMNMANQNPQMRPIISQIQQGVNPQTIFNSLCQQKGINPQEFIKNLNFK